MDKEKVLLTEKEFADIWDTHCKDEPFQWDRLVAEAEARKFLAWMKEECEEHLIPVPAEYGVPEPAGFAYVNRANCPECMAQIEELLK